MFTQEEFESAYEIVSGFNNIRKQINDDPKLLTKLFDIYINHGFEVENYSSVEKYISMRVRKDVMSCYFFLGYPHEYDKNIFEHLNLLTRILYLDDQKINYDEYVNILTSSNFVRERVFYEKMFPGVRDLALSFINGFVFYTDLLELDKYLAEKYLVLLKNLAWKLSKNNHYVTSDGNKWFIDLLDNNLGLNPDDKPEYRVKDGEKLRITIDSDFFDLIDKITSEFDSFVKRELRDSDAISHYFKTHEPFCSRIENREGELFVINTLVEKDMFIVFDRLNHSINIDTAEGKILFLYMLKAINVEIDFKIFNRYCSPISTDSSIIKVRVGIDGLIKSSHKSKVGVDDISSSDFNIKHILDYVDKELSKKYMVLLYRFASVVAKVDGKITEDEEKWLSQLLAMTEADKDSDKEQPESRITQGGSNPIEELESLIGLTSVKKDVVSLANFIKMKKMREEQGLKAPNISYHCVFSGNPGTGKTTVARILANIFKELGILKSGHLVETDRSGLVAEYVGQTAVKTNNIIDSALDGVLFVDEAYTLIGGQNDYGKEAIATLLKRMEDDRDRLIVILAGYSKEMEDFINSNPGLRSRFNRYILFPDYTSSELYDIFQLNATKNEYVINEEANQYLKKKLDIVVQNKQKDFGNARYIRNYFELAIEHQANRLASDVNLTPEKLCELTLDDIDINT